LLDAMIGRRHQAHQAGTTSCLNRLHCPHVASPVYNMMSCCIIYMHVSSVSSPKNNCYRVAVTFSDFFKVARHARINTTGLAKRWSTVMRTDGFQQ
jgi:hypothetical protein